MKPARVWDVTAYFEKGGGAPFSRSAAMSGKTEDFRETDGKRTVREKASPDGAKPLKYGWPYLAVA